MPDAIQIYEGSRFCRGKRRKGLVSPRSKASSPQLLSRPGRRGAASHALAWRDRTATTSAPRLRRPLSRQQEIPLREYLPKAESIQIKARYLTVNNRFSQFFIIHYGSISGNKCSRREKWQRLLSNLACRCFSARQISSYTTGNWITGVRLSQISFAKNGRHPWWARMSSQF